MLDEEVKGLLKEAKAEILKLRGNLDESIAKQLETVNDAQELAAELYLRRKCDGLTEGQKKRVLEMLSGIKDRAEIDRKFDIVLETYDNKEEEEEKEDKEEEEEMKDKEEEEDEDKEEEEEDKDKKDKKDVKEGKDTDDDLNEDSPFKQHLNQYVQILKEGKF